MNFWWNSEKSREILVKCKGALGKVPFGTSQEEAHQPSFHKRFASVCVPVLSLNFSERATCERCLVAFFKGLGANDFPELRRADTQIRYASVFRTHPLNALFLMGGFPVDFQEVKRPIRTKSGKNPLWCIRMFKDVLSTRAFVNRADMLSTVGFFKLHF